MIPLGANKLSPELKQILRRIGRGADRSWPGPGASQPLNVLLALVGPVGPAEALSLRRIASSVRTIAGETIAASVPVDRLTELADLECVRYVELARPLGPESAVAAGPGDPEP
jgi:hypothetical protein